MNDWSMRNGTVTRGPYSICSDIRGYSAWFRRGDKFGVLGREIVTLEKAKEFCEAHRAKEAALMKSLDAVDAK